MLAAAGKLPVDRLAGTVAVGGLDLYAATERAGVRCIGAGGTTAIAHAAQTRGLRLIVAEDYAAAACVDCRETTVAATLEQLVALLAGDQDGDPLPARTAALDRRDPGASRISEGDLRALEIACAGWHNIHVIGPDGRSLPQYGRIAQTLLPDLAGEASRETTKIHGVADLVAPWTARITERPLQVPHYTASRGAVAGSRGGPGEVNLAHNGLVIDQPSVPQKQPGSACAARRGPGARSATARRPGGGDVQADRMLGLIPESLNAGRMETCLLTVAPESAAVIAVVGPGRRSTRGRGRHIVHIEPRRRPHRAVSRLGFVDGR